MRISPGLQKIDDVAGLFLCHVTGAFFKEEKAEEVRAVLEGAKGVLAAGDTAYFYFGRQNGDSRNRLIPILKRILGYDEREHKVIYRGL